jgi:hypothetical protein
MCDCVLPWCLWGSASSLLAVVGESDAFRWAGIALLIADAILEELAEQSQRFARAGCFRRRGFEGVNRVAKQPVTSFVWKWCRGEAAGKLWSSTEKEVSR